LTAFGLHVLLHTLILPPASPLLIGVAGLLLWRRRPRIGMALCAACIVTLWALSVPILADALARSAENYPALDPLHLTANQARAQAIVILGGGFRSGAPEAGGDAPSVVADLRLIEGAKVARATHLPILVSGSAREAAAMRRFMEEDLGLPVRWVESASINTRENAVFSAAILGKEGIRRIILVTSSPHMTRAAAEFAAAGFEVTAAPAEMLTRDELGALSFVPSVMALHRSYAALYELIGRLVRFGT
jgi:uncharacterized SAM-binding protein YcdF (DUF218 family)